MSKPTDTVLAFIAAHYEWDRAALRRHESLSLRSPEREAASDEIEAEYHELVRKFCVPTVVPQGVSYGGNPSHEPNREMVESVEVRGNSATVCTQITDQDGFKSSYEYHMQQLNGDWKIASLLVICGDEKLECL